ncbi:hypothetical protein AURDEDRAFT_60604 [Auricularia subglabra TFB-10046 SS5]|nr:hypothetical protein AURDEDRAFT_60604 [Auricularia subglabra TFB-10046 SS5]
MAVYNPLQDDYVRFPPSTRAVTQAIAAIWKEGAEQGVYHLTDQERFWAELQPYLLSKGYRLHQRYAPGWEPVWVGTDINPAVFEDSVMLPLPRVIDARRVSDEKAVAIKWVPHADHTRHELSVMQLLSSDQLRRDPRNCCNPLLDTFPHPDQGLGIFLVTPWLTDFTYVPVTTVGEVLDMLLQLTEGLVFMHEHGIAHRDCTGFNIMQDITACFPGRRMHPLRPCYSEDMQTTFQPVHNAPRKYWFIDFGVSCVLDGPGPHLVTGGVCRDQSAPELSVIVPYNPFRLDVYLLGNHFLMEYLKTYKNLEFLRPLLLEMTRLVPSQRPTAQQALQALRRISQDTSGFQRRWRLRSRDEDWADVVIEDGGSLARELFFQVTSLLV